MHDHKWFPVNFLNGVGYNFVRNSPYIIYLVDVRKSIATNLIGFKHSKTVLMSTV
jgi:hypothetical protein